MIDVERVDEVAVVRIARPERRNALTLSMVGELVGSVEAQVDQGVVAVVLTGDASAFSSGVDLDELGRGGEDANADVVLADAATRLRKVRVPTVAAIEGACVGGAVELALSCDARVVAEGGFFAIPATRLGILYRPEGIAYLVGLLGRDIVSRLFLFNERIDHNEAKMARLATHVCARGAAVARALDLCEGISRDTMDAVRATKELVDELTSGHGDLGHWSDRREELLSSESRFRALERAKTRRNEKE